MIVDLAPAWRAPIDRRVHALSRHPAIHFSLSCTLFAALMMSRHFDLFSRENPFDRQSLFPQTPTPNVTPEKHLERGSKRHSKERTDDSANDQAPDKNRDNYCHRM